MGGGEDLRKSVTVKGLIAGNVIGKVIYEAVQTDKFV